MEYPLIKTENVTIKIYDSLGKEVKTLLNNEEKPTENYQLSWDGTNEEGERLSSGIYFYRLIIGSQSIVKKAILLK